MNVGENELSSIENERQEAEFDFSKSRTQMLVIQTVRLGFLLATLGISILFQVFQPEFINIEVLLPLYVLLFFGFLLNSLYLFFFEEALRRGLATSILFIYESIFITALIFYTGINQSIFLFLYLVNIILCGFVFLRRGAFFLALWTSILFSLLIIVGPNIVGQTLYFVIGLNNIAFFAVAGLSGFLSEQLDFMGRSLRKQGKDLRALKDLNNIIVDNIATGLMTMDESGVLVQLNKASRLILDLDSQFGIGRHIDEVAPGLLQEISSQQTTSGGYEAARFDFVLKRPANEAKTLEVIASVLPKDNAVTGYVLMFQDLTRVRKLEFQMRQSEKMAAVGQLAAGIAHEIRNPLASISGSVQLLGSSFSSRQEEEQKLMSIILREIDRLNNLITEFLDFVRPDTLQDDPVDVNNLLKEIVEFVGLNQNLRSDVRQIFDLRATQLISGNSAKLRQAFMNIVINAYQAMTEVEAPQIELRTEEKDGRVIVRIKDKGSGIDEVGLRKIFEPFHTTKPKGTGLGLAVTHKIIENHAGRIFVESARGQGTEFIIEFPIRGQVPVDKNALADSKLASENFSVAFKGQKRGHG